MPDAPDNLKHEIPIVLPELGIAGVAVQVAAWYVEPGDAVEPGEPILEVMIPGITCDIPAPAAGIITRLAQPLDAIVSAGDIVAWLAPGERPA
jgi:pyruvate/2-oxoglutarate dehydrogenase complex dihydrolipoamide acyltransferase (E2) component